MKNTKIPVESSGSDDMRAGEGSIVKFMQTCVERLLDLDRGLCPRQAIPLLTLRARGSERDQYAEDGDRGIQTEMKRTHRAFRWRPAHKRERNKRALRVKIRVRKHYSGCWQVNF